LSVIVITIVNGTSVKWNYDEKCSTA